MSKNISQQMSKMPVRIGQNVAIEEAQEVMRMWGMRHLPVTDSNDHIVGIISERDFGRILGSNMTIRNSVAEIMTPNPYVCFPETSLTEVVNEMASSKIGSAIVINRNREVLGIFTTTDAMKILAQMLADDDDDGNYRTLKISDFFVLPHSTSFSSN